MTDWLRYPILTANPRRIGSFDRTPPPPTPVYTLTPHKPGGWLMEPDGDGLRVWIPDGLLEVTGYARVHPKWNSPSYWASLPEEDA